MNKLAILPILALASLSSAHAAVIPVSADSSVSSKKATKKLGTAKTLQVDKSTNTLLRFDLASLPAGTTPEHIAKATLRLWVREKPTPGSLAVALPAGTWTESLVSGASQPTFTPTGIAALVPVEAQSFLEIDVTAVVQGWVDGLANNGLVLTPEIAGNPLKVVFDSRENTQTGREAVLDIELRNVSTFRAFEFSIPAASWDQGFHYGDNNLYRGFDVDPSLTGGIDVASFYANGGVVQVSVQTTGKNGYSEVKPVPYTYSQGTGPYIGMRIEYLLTRGSFVISKTTNGWDTVVPSAAELPSSVKVRMVLIGSPTLGS